MNRKERETIRKGYRRLDNKLLFLYGALGTKEYAIAYCTLHKCYLSKRNINEKGCLRKHCKNLLNGGNYYE